MAIIGSTLNNGNQYIGWKYYTPLKGDYLNTLNGQMFTPGLVTRPKIMVVQNNNDLAQVAIGPFSCILEPTDSNKYEDENGVKKANRMVKVSTESQTPNFSISPGHVAIGFSFSLTDGTHANKDWYGAFKALTVDDLFPSDPANKFEGIIIATIQYFECLFSNAQFKAYSVTTSGADISNVLLEKEGWNPRQWVSLVSPWRAEINTSSEGTKTLNYNYVEVRDGNNSYSNRYIAGNYGLKKTSASNTTWAFPKDGSVAINSGETATRPFNPYGNRGYLGGYSSSNIKGDLILLTFRTNNESSMLVASQGQFYTNDESEGLNQFNNFDGGAIALINAKKVNDNVELNPSDVTSCRECFANRLIIKPVVPEIQNISGYDDTTHTLYIK